MSSNQKESTLPQAVYFDTTALWRFPDGVSNVDFIELRDIAKKIGAGLFVPEIVVEELINQQEMVISEEIGKLKDASEKLGNLLNREPLKYEEPKEIERTINKTIRDGLDSAGIKIIPTLSNVQLETLINMAVKKEAPFQKGDKGFKDTIILFTIIEHLKSNQLSNAILVSNDHVFTHKDVINRFRDNELLVIVKKNITEAKDQIKTQIDTAVRRWLEEKKQKIKSFLNTKKDEIFNYIRENAKISKFFLEFSLRDKNLPEVMEILKILDFHPKEISSVYPSLILSEETPKEGVEYATFSVSVDFELQVEQFSRQRLLGPVVPLATPIDFEKTEWEPPPLDIRQKTVTKDITVEARIYKENEHYSNIDIIKVLTY